MTKSESYSPNPTTPQLNNFKAGHFSFNVEGGRCEKCKGEGRITIDMQFMHDISVRCQECQGLRFQENVLSVKYRSKNIADVLSMTVRDAFTFFRGQPKIQTKLKALIDVGLDYVCLGQPANSTLQWRIRAIKTCILLKRP